MGSSNKQRFNQKRVSPTFSLYFSRNRLHIEKMNISESMNKTGRFWVQEQTDQVQAAIVESREAATGFISLFSFVGALLILGGILEACKRRRAMSDQVQRAIQSKKKPLIAENDECV